MKVLKGHLKSLHGTWEPGVGWAPSWGGFYNAIYLKSDPAGRPAFITYVEGTASGRSFVPVPHGELFEFEIHWDTEANTAYAIVNGVTSPTYPAPTVDLPLWNIEYEQERGNFFIIFPTEKHHLDITINGEGSVLPEDVIGDYWEGSLIELTAAPASGWYFQSWEGTDNDSINPTTVTMDSDKHVVCNFTQVAPAGCLPIVGAAILLVAGIITGIIFLL